MTTTPRPYLERLNELTAARSRLCVGIDPHQALLQQWGLRPDVCGLERFSRAVVEALGAEVAAFKPQSAFFEMYGSGGVAVLERLLADIAGCGALSILDVKRGDIGSTMTGYAQAYLGQGSPLAADAVTLSPYLGYESLRPALDLAASTGRGVYVLARTSNPEGHRVQLATTRPGTNVAQGVVDQAQQDNACGAHHVGLVVGATHADLGITLDGFTGSVLVPGIGAQGARISGLGGQFATAGLKVLPTASREVLRAGPHPVTMRAALAAILSA